MDTKVIVAGLIGGITLFATGFIVYVLLLADFFVTSVMKDPPDFIFIILGELIFGCFLAWVLSRMGDVTLSSGAKSGALIGFLVALAYGFILYGSTTMGDLTYYLVDTVVSAVRYGVAGAAIGWWFSRGSAASAS